jgi:hypothetical protein
VRGESRSVAGLLWWAQNNYWFLIELSSFFFLKILV